MGRIFCISAIAFILAVLCVSVSPAWSGYGVYIPVSFQNTTASDITNTRLVYSVPSANLISQGWLQADAEDLLMAQSLTAPEEDTRAGNLASNTPNWYTDLVTIPAHATLTRQLWMDKPTATRDQNWVAMDTDINYAADNPDNSLDITTDLTLSTDIYLPALPATEKEIISKEGNYELAVDNANFIFRVWGPAATEILRPNAAGASNTNRHNPPDAAGDATNYTYVDEAVADDADYVYAETGAGRLDLYNITNTAIPASSYITGVTVYWRGKTDFVSPGNSCTIPHLYVAAIDYPAGVVTDEGLAFALHSYTWATNPNTTSRWLFSELDSLQAGIYDQAGGGAAVYCSQLYVVVSYFPAYISQIAAGTGQKTITCTYDGANTSITDGTLTDTDALVGALNINAEPVHIAEVTAKLDSTKIGDTNIAAPTWKMNLEYEPTQISATVITDTSASANNVTYSLTGNPGGLIVTTGAMIILSSATPPTYIPTSNNPSVLGELDSSKTAVENMNSQNGNTSSMGDVVNTVGDLINQSGNDPFYNTNLIWFILYGVAVFGVFFGAFGIFKQPWIVTMFVAVVAFGFVALTHNDQVITWGAAFLTTISMIAWSILSSRQVTG
jgi:hypothetical protein